jgi:hypothetical protein
MTAQAAFLEALPETLEKQVITGFDAFAPVQFCTPSFLGCRVCIGANAVGNAIALSVSAHTPLGSFSKSFRITKNISFTWNPVGLFKVEFKITNFRKVGSVVRFDAAIRGCIKVPILGFKCKSFNHTFAVPTSLSDVQRAMLASDVNEEMEEGVNSSNDINTLLLVHALLAERDGVLQDD